MARQRYFSGEGLLKFIRTGSLIPFVKEIRQIIPSDLKTAHCIACAIKQAFEQLGIIETKEMVPKKELNEANEKFDALQMKAMREIASAERLATSFEGLATDLAEAVRNLSDKVGE